MLQNLSSAAVVIGALRIYPEHANYFGSYWENIVSYFFIFLENNAWRFMRIV